MKHMLVQGHHPKRLEPGHQQHLGQENQDSQQRLNRPPGSFPDDVTCKNPKTADFYPLTRSYFENDSLRNILLCVILKRFCTLKIFGKEGFFQGITREISNFSKTIILE